MTRMKKRKGMLAALIVACLILSGIFIVLRTPLAVNGAGALFTMHKGFQIKVQKFSASPFSGASITGLELSKTHGGVSFAS